MRRWAKARQTLRKWAKADEVIEQANKEYKDLCDDLDAMAVVATISKYGDSPRYGSGGHPVETIAEKRMELREKYRTEMERLNKRIAETVELKNKVDDILLLASSHEQFVIEQLYKGRKTYTEIAEELKVDVRTVRRLERMVLEYL